MISSRVGCLNGPCLNVVVLQFVVLESRDHWFD